MSPGIRTNAAAEVLGVSPNTLRSWERRYGYPEPRRSKGNHRQYELVELQTLRDALSDTGNIASAIELARQRQSSPTTQTGLAAAFERFDELAADRAMEESLAVRPVERTVEELLLPAIDSLASETSREAELEFGCRWAIGWLLGARRLAAAASRPAGVLLLDSGGQSDVESVHSQALELSLRRTGFRVLSLSSALGGERLERALSALEPTAIVVCGDTGSGSDALLARIRELGYEAPVLAFRSGAWELGASSPRPAADRPSELTQLLNSDLRRRAASAFA